MYLASFLFFLMTGNNDNTMRILYYVILYEEKLIATEKKYINNK